MCHIKQINPTTELAAIDDELFYIATKRIKTEDDYKRKDELLRKRDELIGWKED